MNRGKEFNQLVKHFAICCQYKIDAPEIPLLPVFRAKLVTLRNAKFSWVDRTENEVRNAVDLFLRENP
jgi:hypothetical protein